MRTPRAPAKVAMLPVRVLAGAMVCRCATLVKAARTMGQWRFFSISGRYTRGMGETLLRSLYSGTTPPLAAGKKLPLLQSKLFTFAKYSIWS